LISRRSKNTEADFYSPDDPHGGPSEAGGHARTDSSTHTPIAQARAPTSGKVIDQDRKQPLSNVRVHLRGSNFSVHSDENGIYQLPPVETKIQVFEFYLKGYQAVQLTTRVRADEALPTVALPKLKDEALQVGELITVTGTIIEAPQVVERILTVPELQRIPGSFNDAVRAVQNLPGVARSPIGVLIVRGTEPQDTGYYIDGIRVPNIFHFFGLHTVLNSDILQQVTFLPGNYGVRYGRTYGGVIDAVTTEDIPQALEGYLGVDLLNSQAFLKTPMGNHGGLYISVRRSYLDLILEQGIRVAENLQEEPINLGIRQAPQYWDYQILYNKQLNPRNFIHAMLFGAHDTLRIVASPPAAIPPEIRGDGEVINRSGFDKGLIRWRYSGNSFTNQLTLSIGPDFQQFGFGNLSLSAGSSGFFGREDLSFKLEPLPNLTLRTGLDFLLGLYSFDISIPFDITDGSYDPLAPPSKFTRSLDGLYLLPSVYLEGEYQLTSRLRATPGIRIDPMFIPDIYTTLWVDPRLNLVFTAGRTTFLKASVGRFGEQPPPFAVDEAVGGDPTLKSPYSLQYMLGIDHGFSSFISLETSLFYADLNRLVVIPHDDSSTPDVSSFTNDGRGRNYGLEVLLRHNPHAGFFGWISYTLQRAQRIDGPSAGKNACEDPATADGACWYDFNFDQTHIFTALGSYDLPHNWILGLRFRYSTGLPYTSIAGAYYDADTDQYEAIPSVNGQPNDQRLPAFNDLTLRVDKNFTIRRVKVNAYLEVINIYNRDNPETVDYNFDYTEVTYGLGLPIFPNLGIKVEFK